MGSGKWRGPSATKTPGPRGTASGLSTQPGYCRSGTRKRTPPRQSGHREEAFVRSPAAARSQTLPRGSRQHQTPAKAPARPHTEQEGPAPPTRARAPEAPASTATGLPVEPHLLRGRQGASATAGPAWPGEGHRRAPRTPPLTPASWHTRAAVRGSGPGPGALNNVPAALPRCPRHDVLWLPSSRANWTSALTHTARKECAPGPAPTGRSAVSGLASAEASSMHGPRLPRAAHGTREQRKLQPIQDKQRHRALPSR